jgi:hypothetical protein
MIISRSHRTKPLLIASHVMRRRLMEELRFSAPSVPSWLRFLEFPYS